MTDIAKVTCKGEEFYLDEWQFKQYEKFDEQAQEQADGILVLEGEAQQEWLENARWNYLKGMTDRPDDENVCCFCGSPLKDFGNGMYGHNPYPANTIPGKRCCDKCNQKIVIPARCAIYDLIRETDKERESKENASAK